MTDATTSTQPRPLISYGRMRMTWQLSSLLWTLLGDCLRVVWSDGATVNSSLTDQQNGRLDIESAKGMVTLTANKGEPPTTATVTVTAK